MALYLTAKTIDISTGDVVIVVLNNKDADSLSIRPGDALTISHGEQSANVTADVSRDLVKEGEIGLFNEVSKRINVKEGEVVGVDYLGSSEATKAIVKKLLKNDLNEQEIHAVIEGIVTNHLGTIETTYFAACGFSPGFTDKELYYMTKAIANTGNTIDWKKELGLDVVVDKHSIGGIPGKGVTPILVSIVASLGLVIPDAPSRAITAPAGTADVMEVLCPVTFTRDEVVDLVKKAGACIVWGGGLDIAPADEALIRIEKPLGIELYDKFIVSILAKKVAMGINHLVLDLPTGEDTKVEYDHEVPIIRRKFISLAEQFGMKIHVMGRHPLSPDGRGIGPVLEARDILMVLEQSTDRYLPLESLAVGMSGALLELCGHTKPGKGEEIAREQLVSGKALEKFKEIIKNQGGNPDVSSTELPAGDVIYVQYAQSPGEVVDIDNKMVREVASALGCPHNKKAGIFLYKQVGEAVKKEDKLLKLYSTSTERLDTAKQLLADKEIIILK